MGTLRSIQITNDERENFSLFFFKMCKPWRSSLVEETIITLGKKKKKPLYLLKVWPVFRRLQAISNKDFERLAPVLWNLL